MSLGLDEMNERGEGAWLPGAVTLAELREAGVCWCLGTVFTWSGGDDETGFEPFDVEAAHWAGERQMAVYRDWATRGWIDIAEGGRFGQTTSSVAGDEAAGGGRRLVVGVLMENADPIRTPDELGWWVDSGVVAIGLTWKERGRYAGGNGCVGGEAVLTDLGKELLDAMEEEGVVLDVSHLSDAALDAALERFGGGVIASHSNCRSIVGVGEPEWDQRHLTDEAIKEIGRRGGVIGLNLVRYFIRRGLAADDPARPSVSEALDHVERVCELVGSRACVGLGTDMDGGITACDLPEGIDRARDVVKLVEALGERGWCESDLAGFARENWLRVFASR